MKRYALVMLTMALFALAACETAPPAVPLCPLPGGYRMEPALETAESTLRHCPQRLEEVFAALVAVGSHKPDPQHREAVKEMLKRLSTDGVVSERMARGLYNKHFDVRFVSLPDTKTYNLGPEIEAIKAGLRAELALKKKGLVGCCGDREGYQKAEGQFARIVNMMENLALNEDYLRGEMAVSAW